jgi:hypothetical protein
MKKKRIVVRRGKNARQTFFCRAFFRRASWKKHTSKHLFVMRPKKCARRTPGRTANMEFAWVSKTSGIS